MDRHFTLTSRSGIYTAPGSRPTVIGQTDGCDLRLPNKSEYQDTAIAKIAPDRDGGGWHLVRLSRYHDIMVNGVVTGRVSYLADGDNIEIDGEAYRFNVREGEIASPTVIHIHSNHKTTAFILALVAVIAAVVAYRIYDSRREKLTDKMCAQIESSIFTLRVDSLQLIFRDSVVAGYTYTSSPTGTAFLTTDSLIVTARHCIQPWLNRILPADFAGIPAVADWPVAKALYAETANQLSGSDDMRIVSFMTLTDEEGNVESLTSDDFMFNTEFDDIVELGSYTEPCYWRSISHRYTRRDMMLGDIAAARADRPGTIQLADSATLVDRLDRRGAQLYFFGHPESEVNGSRLETKTDELRLPLETLPEYPGRLFLIAHEGGLTPGFSGGPVIVRDGIGFRAVGVISVTDDRNGNRSYSVPTTEIPYLK